MRLPGLLTTALILSFPVAGIAEADNPSPLAPAEAAVPALAPAAATAAEAPAPAAAPAAVHDTVHTPPAAGTAEKPAAEGAAAPEAAPEKVAAEDDPVVCRSQIETGTMGRRQKICMTKSQWDAQRNAARRFKRSIDQSRATQPGGGG